MKEIGLKNPSAKLSQLNLLSAKKVFWNASANKLIEETLNKKQGTLSNTGALSIKTGRFTGRSPQDRFIVEDEVSASQVDWNAINQKFNPDNFMQLKTDICQYLEDKDLYIKDAALGRDPLHQINARVICEFPWSALFVHNMFIRLDNEAILDFDAEWTIYVAPGFKATPSIHGTTNENFSIINFKSQTILIGGTGYTGEIKKGMFSVLNFKLPIENQILSMHCSANVGNDGRSAIFFGLSGTGKTTLSADPARQLIGDDEHGWSDEGLFNFEGGCYAKCIGLDPNNEPDIFRAIRPGALLENIILDPNTNAPDFNNTSITENTRVSYPINHIDNCYNNDVAQHPEHIFFLTCDAFGILPPISKLTAEQAMYYFISGYTAKVAGTEEGVIEPQATFSACFGAPFLPLHPTQYAQLLGEKIKKHNVKIWLVNTGWTGGPYGVGKRIALKYTRTLINAVFNGDFDTISFTNVAVFDLKIPSFCKGVPGEILHPRNSWHNKEAYNHKRLELAKLFTENFKQFENKTDASILQAQADISMQLV